MGCSPVGLCCIQSLQNGQGSIPSQAWIFFRFFCNCLGCSEKNTLYLSVNVFSMKVLKLGTLFLHLVLETGMSFYVVISKPREGLAACSAKGVPLIPSFLRPWVLVRPQESNPRPPALQSQASPTGLTLPRSFNFEDRVLFHIFIHSSKYDSFCIYINNSWFISLSQFKSFLSFIRVLEEELGIHCNMTLLFSFAQVSKSCIITEFP